MNGGKNTNTDTENTLSTLNDYTLANIYAIADIDTLLDTLKKLTVLKDVLDACNKFHENAIKYAKLEAAALLHVVELGGVNKLKGNRLATAKWLANLNNEERKHFIAMCGEGLTIEQIYKREISDPTRLKQKLSHYDILCEAMVDELKETGIVTLSKYTYDIPNHLPHRLADAVKNSFRKAIRENGGVAIGDNNGTYVAVYKGESKEIKSAILVRLNSIQKDLNSILEIEHGSENWVNFPVDIMRIINDISSNICFLEKEIME